jgi:16S rRNA processing protein RimM
MAARQPEEVDWTSMALVGRVIRPHGNRGHVVVASETDFGDERFAVGSTLYVERDGALGTVTVVATREQGGRWVVGFDGVGSIDAAETLRGLELRVPGDALHELAEGRFYVHDLVGCAVRSTAGDAIGAIERVDFNAGIPLLVVADAARAGDEILVPFTDLICRRIDVAERVVEIDPPEGLIDLNRRKQK